MKSRELVLDAAERVMAEHGYEAATVARVVEEAGIPLSSVYHYFGSKEGLLLAVMERGADRFFTGLPRWDRRAGRPAQHLAAVLAGVVRTLERHPHFLRLLIVLAAQPPAADNGEVQAVIDRIRGQARQLLRAQIGLAFGDDPDSPATDHLARFARPPSTAPSWPARPTGASPSRSCSSRSRSPCRPAAGYCWPRWAERPPPVRASNRAPAEPGRAGQPASAVTR